jgi:hypothetical protein
MECGETEFTDLPLGVVAGTLPPDLQGHNEVRVASII